MNPLDCRRLARQWAGAALLLAASLFVLPRAAEAGCSHPWIADSSSPMARLHDLDVLRLGGAPADADRRHAPDHETPSPCARGHCSPASDLPSQAVPPTKLWREPSGLLAATAKGEVTASGAIIPESVPLRPVTAPFPIDRPPRLPFPTRTA